MALIAGQAPRADLTCMMVYDKRFGLPHAFDPEVPRTTLNQVLSAQGIEQFHCAETEKYAHVTFFFNGGNEEPAAGEVHRLIPSPMVKTYDLKPEMSALQVADAVVEAIESGNLRVYCGQFRQWRHGWPYRLIWMRSCMPSRSWIRKRGGCWMRRWRMAIRRC